MITIDGSSVADSNAAEFRGPQKTRRHIARLESVGPSSLCFCGSDLLPRCFSSSIMSRSGIPVGSILGICGFNRRKPSMALEAERFEQVSVTLEAKARKLLLPVETTRRIAPAARASASAAPRSARPNSAPLDAAGDCHDSEQVGLMRPGDRFCEASHQATQRRLGVRTSRRRRARRRAAYLSNGGAPASTAGRVSELIERSSIAGIRKNRTRAADCPSSGFLGHLS